MRHWFKDKHFKSLLKNSGYLAVSKAVAAVAALVAPVKIDEADRPFLSRAAELAAEIDWSHDAWHALTAALKADTGRKGRALFLPL